MHQLAITVEQFADIRAKLEVFGEVDEGPVLTTIGKHPVLGSCILLRDLQSDPMLLSEVPFDTKIRTEKRSVSLQVAISDVSTSSGRNGLSSDDAGCMEPKPQNRHRHVRDPLQFKATQPILVERGRPRR